MPGWTDYQEFRLIRKYPEEQSQQYEMGRPPLMHGRRCDLIEAEKMRWPTNTRRVPAKHATSTPEFCRLACGFLLEYAV
jgi:hypothetical protein